MMTRKITPPILVDQAEIFKLLSHPCRLAILYTLRSGEECVCHMEATLGYRQAYLSQQLAVLREAGIIQDRRDGWNIFYRVIRTDIYPILDAVNALVGSPADAPQGRVTAATCPCPKCTSSREQA
ncbi:MAG TPA: metalloregulator ArsR/SmtB family transcription factor [Anaerolineaceae bacterium]|jgi:ArsR family transcriptional regulator|nr:metalloregulator ArsR/SmtB family transcription factor [Anaerolineaceae bacterium]